MRGAPKLGGGRVGRGGGPNLGPEEDYSGPNLTRHMTLHTRDN